MALVGWWYMNDHFFANNVAFSPPTQLSCMPVHAHRPGGIIIELVGTSYFKPCHRKCFIWKVFFKKTVIMRWCFSYKVGWDKSQPSPYVLPDLLLNYPFNFQFGTIWGYKSPYKVIKFVLRLKCSANQFHPPIFGACTYCTFNETIKLFKLFIFSLDWSTLFS